MQNVFYPTINYSFKIEVFFYHMHNIRCIKRYLSCDSLLTFIHAFITSCLDYCKSLVSLSKLQILKLQCIQGEAVELAMNKHSQVTFSTL